MRKDRALAARIARDNAPHAAVESLERRALMHGYPITFGGSGFDAVTAVDQTADGTVYVAGLFSGTADFQPGSGKTLLTSRGETNVFIASYSVKGKLLWVKQLGSTYDEGGVDDFDERDFAVNPARVGSFVGRVGDGTPSEQGVYAFAIKADGAGNVYVGGSFIADLDFSLGAGTDVRQSQRPFGIYYDAYILQLNAGDGAVKGANTFGGPFNDAVLSLDTAVGSVYAGGYFTREADLDPSGGVANFTTEGRGAGFILKAAPVQRAGVGSPVALSLAWAVTIGGDAVRPANRDVVNDIAVDANGNVYATGAFASDKADFQPGPGRTILKAKDGTDAFTALYSARGKLVWVTQAGGDGLDAGLRVATVGSAVYTAGYFEDEIDIDPGAAVQTFVATNDDFENDDGADADRTDVYLTRQNAADGSLAWADQIRGNQYETVGALTADENGVSLAGSFYETIDLDPGRRNVFRTSAELIDDRDRDRNDRGRDDFSYDAYFIRLSAKGRYFLGDIAGGGLDDLVTAGSRVPFQRLLYGGQFSTITLSAGKQVALTEEDAVVGRFTAEIIE
jgi:hypothetical protein